MTEPIDRASILARSSAALKAGQLRLAVDLLQELLKSSANDLDALHLLGTVHFHRGEFEAAVQLFDRVLEQVPDAAPVIAIRTRAADALGRRIVEQEVCQSTLPRLRPMVTEAWRPADANDSHVVLASAAIDDLACALASQAAATLLLEHPTYWRETFPPLRPGARWPTDSETREQMTTIEPQRWTFPRSGNIVFVGAARSPAAWWPRSSPAGVVLAIDEFVACEIIERIRELGGDGTRRISLLYKDADIARRARLPGVIMAPTP